MMLAAVVTASAQGIDPRFYNNQFLSLGGGLTLYNNAAAVTTGYNAELSIGNWILKDMALRISLGTASAQNARNLTSTFYYGHCNFMWDVIGTITGSSHAKNVVSVYPMIGFGFIYRPNIPFPSGYQPLVPDWPLTEDSNAYRFDIDFMAVVGAHVEFRIPTPAMRTWPFFLEAKLFLLPEDYDFNHKSNLTNISFGIKHDIQYDPYHRSIAGESRGWNYDWFVGLGAGPNFSIMKVESPEVVALDRLGFNADITVGRNFSSLWTVRLGFSVMGGTTEVNRKGEGFDALPYKYLFFNARADLMFNVINIGGMRRGRRFGLLPYAGAGAITRFDDKLLVMEADAGIMARWYISRSLDIYLDGRYSIVPPRFNWGHESFNNGYPTLNVGVIYNFEPSSSRYSKAAFRLRN